MLIVQSTVKAIKSHKNYVVELNVYCKFYESYITIYLLLLNIREQLQN